MTSGTRLVVLAASVVVVVLAVAAVALGDVRRHGSTPASGEAAAPTGPRLVFRHTGRDSRYGVVAEVPLADPSGPRHFTGVSCDRVDAVAGTVSCLRSRRGVVTTFDQVLLDAHWHPTQTVGLPGIPSRTRLSDDGRLVASTTFVSGHSYVSSGFSTATEIRDVGGRSHGNLERFALVLDGHRASPVDRNVWGVTFAADDNTFYATVSTGGSTYLARGDLRARTLTTIADHVECPSLSPDGSRIAFKQRVSHGFSTWWTPAVLDLRTLRRTVLSGEHRNVDDQIEWLDGHTLLYGLARASDPGVYDVWSLRTDPAAAPHLFVAEAWSPAVVR